MRGIGLILQGVSDEINTRKRGEYDRINKTTNAQEKRGRGGLFKNKKSHVEIGLENIIQEDGYELLSFEIPSLAQSDSSEADFFNYYNGGRTAKLCDALPQSFDFNYDTCNIVSVNSSEGTFCIEAEDVENILQQ